MTSNRTTLLRHLLRQQEQVVSELRFMASDVRTVAGADEVRAWLNNELETSEAYDHDRTHHEHGL